LKIVSPCLVRDLPVYRLAYESLLRHLPGARPHVITERGGFPRFRNACGAELTLLDENELIPEMRLADLRKLPLPFFPSGAGWYFQQFLKWSFASLCSAEESYLIWDADTILLRPISLQDAQGRTLLTQSTEYHDPYFATFEAMFGIRPGEKCSFISQHQWIEVSILRELIGRIEQNSERAWPWEIMHKLRGAGSNLFSEFETYGHYCRTYHPGSCVIRELPWTRDGRTLAGFPPDPSRLTDLSTRYAFASFESNRSLKGLCVHWLRKLLHWY
jgi:hypothetical protein